MRKSIGGSFLFIRSMKGGGAYESDLNMGERGQMSKLDNRAGKFYIKKSQFTIKNLVFNLLKFFRDFYAKLWYTFHWILLTF